MRDTKSRNDGEWPLMGSISGDGGAMEKGWKLPVQDLITWNDYCAPPPNHARHVNTVFVCCTIP